MTTTRRLLVNSAVAFVLACLLMITLHELAHALAAVIQGNHPVMFGFTVEDDSKTDTQDVVTALAGPVFSLVSGLLVLALPVPPALSPFWRLAVLWFGLLSVQEFSGYLVTGPFAGIGDIGSALDTMDAPAVVGWIGFLIGWAITYALGLLAVRRLARFAAAGAFAEQLRAVGLFAWLLGAVLTIVLSLGLFGAGDVSFASVAFEAFGLVASGIFLVFVRLFMAGTEPADRAVELPVPVAGLGLVMVLAVLRQVLLVGGISF